MDYVAFVYLKNEAFFISKTFPKKMIGSVTKILKSHPDILTNKSYPIGIGSLITPELIQQNQRANENKTQ